MAESPLHYRDAVETQKDATGAMNVGTAEHCMVLEPDQFPPRYVVWTGGRRAGKEWDNFEAANLDKTIIKADEYDALHRDEGRGHRPPRGRPHLHVGGRGREGHHLDATRRRGIAARRASTGSAAPSWT